MVVPAFTSRRRVRSTAASPAAELDLQTQLEGLLDAVWKAEADWRLNDRIDISLKVLKPDSRR